MDKFDKDKLRHLENLLIADIVYCTIVFAILIGLLIKILMK